MADEIEQSESVELPRVDSQRTPRKVKGNQSTQEVPKRKGIRGPKLQSKGPWAIAARSRGMSLRSLALALGLNYHTVAIRNQRGQMSEDERKLLLAKLPPPPEN